MMNKPSVDVVIPLYNKTDSIVKCIESVASQEQLPAKLIVVNDGSTDDSLSKVRSALDLYPGNYLLIDQINSGVSIARNRGVDESESKYVCFLDADDLYHPYFISKMISLILDFPEAGLYCLGHRYTFYDKSIDQNNSYFPEGFRGYVDDFFKASLSGSVANSSKVCVNKEVFKEIKGFPSGVTVGEDLFVWIMFALHGRVAFDSVIGVDVFREYHDGKLLRKGYVPYPLEYFNGGGIYFENPSFKKYLNKIAFKHLIYFISIGDLLAVKKIKIFAYSISFFLGLMFSFCSLVPSSVIRCAVNVLKRVNLSK